LERAPRQLAWSKEAVEGVPEGISRLALRPVARASTEAAFSVCRRRDVHDGRKALSRQIDEVRQRQPGARPTIRNRRSFPTAGQLGCARRRKRTEVEKASERGSPRGPGSPPPFAHSIPLLWS